MQFSIPITGPETILVAVLAGNATRSFANPDALRRISVWHNNREILESQVPLRTKFFVQPNDKLRIRIKLSSRTHNRNEKNSNFNVCLRVVARNRLVICSEDVIRANSSGNAYLSYCLHFTSPGKPPGEPRRKISSLQSNSTSFHNALLLRDVTSDQELARDTEPQVKSKSASRYPVWFGTNRKLTTHPNGDHQFSAERSSTTTYGRCDVHIPKSHLIGSLGSPWWKRFLKGQDDRLYVVGTELYEADSFWRNVETYIAKTDGSSSQAVIFIHGFNTKFSDAVVRAAQIGFDLQFEGAMGLFSWPSRATLKDYLTDESSIEFSEMAIVKFLIDFATRSKATSVNVIAHSMGNRGLMRAVDRIVRTATAESSVYFDQVILAAADVDADTFSQFCSAYQKAARRTTMYVSDMDRAIAASEWLHTYARIGLVPPVNVFAGIDTIRVRKTPLMTLGHGYIAEAREVLADMHELITQGREPSSRFGLRESKNELGRPYWTMRD